MLTVFAVIFPLGRKYRPHLYFFTVFSDNTVCIPLRTQIAFFEFLVFKFHNRDTRQYGCYLFEFTGPLLDLPSGLILKPPLVLLMILDEYFKGFFF